MCEGEHPNGRSSQSASPKRVAQAKRQYEIPGVLTIMAQFSQLDMCASRDLGTGLALDLSRRTGEWIVQAVERPGSSVMIALRIRKGMTRRLPMHVYQTWNFTGWESALVRVPLARTRPVERSNVAAPNRPVQGLPGVEECVCDDATQPSPAMATASTIATAAAVPRDLRLHLPRASAAVVPTWRLYGRNGAHASRAASPTSRA
jgi:hypothetical protein